MKANTDVSITRQLVFDGVKYMPFVFDREDKLEDRVFSNYRHIFGPETVLLSKRKIKTASGNGTIPDAFLIDIVNKRWFVIEVELANHPIYEHVVPQLLKFVNSLKNPETIPNLSRQFDDEVGQDKELELRFWKSGIRSERYRFITDVLNTSPIIALIIDQKSENIERDLPDLGFRKMILEFKAYVREKASDNIAIYEMDNILENVEVSNFPTETKRKEVFSATDSEISNLSEINPVRGQKMGFAFMRFPDSQSVTVKTWRSILLQTVKWLVDTNKLTPTNFRKRIEGTKVELYLRIKSPYNNKAYFAPRDVGPFELEVNFDAPDTIRLTKSFLNAAGIDLSAVILSK